MRCVQRDAIQTRSASSGSCAATNSATEDRTFEGTITQLFCGVLTAHCCGRAYDCAFLGYFGSCLAYRRSCDTTANGCGCVGLASFHEGIDYFFA